MKSQLLTIIISAVMFLGVSASNADIVVLDFESLSTPGTGYTYLGSSYIESGFNLEAVPTGGLFYFHSDDDNFPGSTALFAMSPGGSNPDTILTHAGGFTFDLLYLDISESWQDCPSISITLIGTRSNNSTVTSSFILDGVFGFETFTPQGFTDLTSLRMVQDCSYQYDNITLDVIPEPSTVLFLGSGLLLLKKRKNWLEPSH